MIPGKRYTPADLLAILRRRAWLAIVPLALVTGATVLFTNMLPDRYRAETLILVVPQRVPESYVKSTVTTRIEDRLQSISQQILSRTRLERIIQDFNLYATARKTQLMEDVVARMRQDIQVEIVKGDSFRVSYIGEEPRTVMQVTQRLASLFIDENLRDREVLAEQTNEFLDSQLNEARRKLVEHEKKLEGYRRKYAGQLPTQLDSNLQVIHNTQMQIQALNDSLARDMDRRLVVERAIVDLEGQVPPPPPAPTADEAAGGTAQQQLAAAQEALRQLELHLTPEHPDVIRLRRRIVTLTAQAKAEVEQARAAARPALSPVAIERRDRLEGLKAELENIDRQIARKQADIKQLQDVAGAYQARVEATPTRESELIDLTRDYDTLQKTYVGLLFKQEDSKIAANLERRQIGEQFKVLDPARVPEKPYSPDRQRLDLMGAGLGLAIGLGLIVLLEYLDTSLKTDDDVLVALSLPVLALVPFITTDREQRKDRRRRLGVAATSAAVIVVAAVFIVWKLGS